MPQRSHVGPLHPTQLFLCRFAGRFWH